MSTKDARHLAYCEQALLTATGDRRDVLAAKAEHLRAQLAGRCRECGREIVSEDALASGLGSTCRRKQARAGAA